MPEILLGIDYSQIYTDAFDQAGGSANITNSAQEGILTSNPALLGVGNRAIRWAGLSTTYSIGKKSTDIIKSYSDLEKNATKNEVDSAKFIGILQKNPVHIGITQTLSLVSNWGGVLLLGKTHPDLKIWKYGHPTEPTGLPSAYLQTQTLGAGVVGFTLPTVFSFLHLGVSVKHIASSSITKSLDLSSTDVEAAQTEFTESATTSLNRGTGADLGSIISLYGTNVDLMVASTVSNVGGLKLVSPDSVTTIEQSQNIGASITIHNDSSSLSLSAQLKDIHKTADTEYYKRLSLGTKLTLFSFLGIATGLHDGSPTYGITLNPPFIRISATTLTKEYLSSPGLDRRQIYLLSLSFGSRF